MTRWFLDSSLKFSRLVLALAIAVLAIGVTALRSASVDVYPEFRQPTVEVQAEALGLSAVEVEQLITVPLEQDLLNGVPWVERITSRSIPGLSSVEMVFEEGTDLYRARQVVQERMTQAHALPGVGTPPVVIQPRASVNRVAMIGMSSGSATPIAMSVLARWQIKPRLLGVPGVANVSVYGQRDRQLQVQVDPQRLHANKVTLTRLIETTGNALWVSPLSFVEASSPGTGGFVETPNQRIGVQHVSPITSADQLADVVIEGGSGAPQRIGDVADVVEDHQPMIGDAAVDAQPTIMIVVDKFPEANTTQVTRDVATAMADLQPGLTGIVVDTEVYRPASFIENALSHLGVVALIGLLLMVAVLGLAMASWQAALIGLITVPFSVTAALYVLHLRGATFTTMTVLGLAAAVALVIDDLVTDVDRVRRILRENATTPDPLPRGAVVVDALLQSRRPLVYATVIVLLGVAPLILLTGVVGSFTRPAAISYALALLASLLVAVTLTPALLLLRGGRATREPALLRWVTRGFDRIVAPAILRRGRALAATAVLVLAGLAVIPQLGSGVTLPTQQDRNLLVRLEAAHGTALPEMTRVTGAVSRELRALPGVTKVGSHVGRALTSDQVVDVNSAELWVTIAPDADHGATTSEVRRVATGYPGLHAEIGGYADERIAAAGRTAKADLVVRVYGGDVQTLRSTADSVKDVVGTVRGVVAPHLDAVPTQPTVRVEVDLDRARKYGLKPGDVRRETATLISGLLVGNLYEQQKVFDVVVWGGPAARQSPAALESLLVNTPAGEQVRLGDLATVSIAPEPAVIAHDAVRRYLDVLATVPSRDIGEVTSEVTTRLRGLTMPLEYRAEVVTSPSPAQKVTGPLLGWLTVALVGIFLLFQAATNSWRTAVLLTLAAPLAGAGAVLVAPLVGGITSAGALAGFLGIVGLAVRQSLVLVARAQAMAETTAGASRSTAIVAAARERAAPIVLSCLAVAALVLPAAVTTVDGMEFLHPAAVTLLTGLLSCAIVTGYIVPALYAGFVARDRDPRPPAPPQQRTVDLTSTSMPKGS